MGKKRVRPLSFVELLRRLNNDILLHIFSLLTAKQSSKIAILSKTFASIWASSSSLVFDQSEFDTIGQFIEFVDLTLAARNRSSTVTRLSIQWHGGFDAEKSTAWLESIVSRGIRDLNICIPVGNATTRGAKMITLPRKLYGSQIRNLTLQWIQFTDDHLQVLISSCPLLEILKAAVIVGGNTIRASAPNLRLLRLIFRATDSRHRIEISAPRLEVLDCMFHQKVPEFDLGNLRRLASALCVMKGDGNGGDNLLRFIRSLSNTRTLILTGDTIQTLSSVLSGSSSDGHGSSNDMALTFSQLKTLEIRVSMNKGNIRVIIMLLKSVTNLERLIIYNTKKDRNVVGNLAEARVLQKFDKEECLCHLKEIEINGLNGSSDELELMRFLVEQLKKNGFKEKNGIVRIGLGGYKLAFQGDLQLLLASKP